MEESITQLKTPSWPATNEKAYYWQVHMENGAIIEFSSASGKSCDRFIEDVQRYLLKGKKANIGSAFVHSQTYEFEGGRSDSTPGMSLTIDISKVQAVVCKHRLPH